MVGFIGPGYLPVTKVIIFLVVLSPLVLPSLGHRVGGETETLITPYKRDNLGAVTASQINIINYLV